MLEDKIVLLGVASIWHDRKGLWLFNDLAYKLDDSYKIVLIGVTDKQKARLPQNILYINRTDNLIELAEIYSAADIFLNPSIEETFGLVSLEALACGTPVISNKYSANPELIDEQCGIVVDDITTPLFIEAINRLKIKPINREACLNKAQKYNKKNSFQIYLDLYNE